MKDLTGEVASFSKVDGPLGELGNFYPLPYPTEALGRRWRTGEALYQALKFPSRPDVQESIPKADKPIVAKEMGCSEPIRRDWDHVRVDAMRYLLRVKRDPNQQLIDEALKRTRTARIVEVSHHGDDWWGAVPHGDKYLGHNVLGQLRVGLREQIRAGLPTAASCLWASRACVRAGSRRDELCHVRSIVGWCRHE